MHEAYYEATAPPFPHSPKDSLSCITWEQSHDGDTRGIVQFINSSIFRYCTPTFSVFGQNILLAAREHENFEEQSLDAVAAFRSCTASRREQTLCFLSWVRWVGKVVMQFHTLPELSRVAPVRVAVGQVVIWRMPADSLTNFLRRSSDRRVTFGGSSRHSVQCVEVFVYRNSDQ